MKSNPVEKRQKAVKRGPKADIDKLRLLMERLRGPKGCPWDRAQTLKTLVPFIIEEAYEVISAIDEGDDGSIREELGDLLFQIIFACQIKSEEGRFNLKNVIDGTHGKMVRRHPHVFGTHIARTPEEVLRKWAQIKKEEKIEKGSKAAMEGYLSGVPEVLPALLRAHKISARAAKAGFDWKDLRQVLKKVDEEMDEFKDAVRKGSVEEMEHEIGDLLFTIVNVSRFLEVNPEDALRKTIGKFIRRFHHVEDSLREKGKDFTSSTMDEMDSLWEEAKEREKKRAKKTND